MHPHVSNNSAMLTRSPYYENVHEYPKWQSQTLPNEPLQPTWHAIVRHAGKYLPENLPNLHIFHFFHMPHL